MRDPSTDGAVVRVSCVIPTRDRWDLLEQSLLSALQQEGVDHEVIVVDDGSREPMPSPLRAAVGGAAVLRVVRSHVSHGVAVARNRGIAEARGEYVAFLDDDDFWAPDHLARLLAAAEASGAGFAFAGKLDVDDGFQPLDTQPAPPARDVLHQLLEDNVVGTPSCVLVRRAALERLGGFDPSYSVLADWELWLRLAEAETAARVDALTVLYRVHDGNMHLAVPELLEEHARLSQAVGARLGIEDLRLGSVRFEEWIAGIHRRKGERGKAAAWYLRSWRRARQPRDLLRAVGVVFGERLMARYRAVERPAPAPVVAPDEPVARVLTPCRTDFSTSS